VISTVFLGTPEASVPTLRAAAALTTVRLVVTRPDKPRGRSGKARPAPVKEAATSLGIPVEQPSNRRELDEVLARMAPFDLGVVVAFGMILSPAALMTPDAGFANVHFSVLPRWRGAAPVERAILSGDETTGVTLMRMDEGLDTGPVLATVLTPIGATETAGELTDRLAKLGADLFGGYVTDPEWRNRVPAPQTETGATYAERITAAEANLAANRPSVELLRAIRAYAPRPGARFGGGALKVWRAGPTELEHNTPGRLSLEDRRLCLGTADQPIELIEVQAPGGRRMDGTAWARGRHGDLGWLL
jgi:methionyl-tRNA formyltransferase